jgi:hypothetical protein
MDTLNTSAYHKARMALLFALVPFGFLIVETAILWIGFTNLSYYSDIWIRSMGGVVPLLFGLMAVIVGLRFLKIAKQDVGIKRSTAIIAIMLGSVDVLLGVWLLLSLIFSIFYPPAL